MTMYRVLGVVVLMASVVLAARPKETDRFEDPASRIKLDSSGGFVLAIRTDGFGLGLDGTVCEFRDGDNKEPVVGVTGAVLHHEKGLDPAAYAKWVLEAYQQSKHLGDVQVVKQEKLDRKPGEWLVSEYVGVEFNTHFRHIHLTGTDGKQNYALVIFCNAREDEQMAHDDMAKIIAGFAVTPADATTTVDKPKDPTTKPADEPLAKGLAGLAYAAGATDRGESDVFVLKEGQTQPVNLTQSPGNDLQPAWSADGKRLAFVSGRGSADRSAGKTDGIYVMNADGSGAKKITRDDDPTACGPRWSHDGKWIAFASGKPLAVKIVNVDDGQVRDVTRIADSDCFDPDWSPDGKRIVFCVRKGVAYVGGLSLINPDGMEQTAVNPTNGRNCRRPRWSADGKQIVFTWVPNGDAGLEVTTGATMIVNPEGTNLRWNRLEPDRQPMFLPKLKKLAFLTASGDVYLKNLDYVTPTKATAALNVIDYDISPLADDEPLALPSIPKDIVFARAAGPDARFDICAMSADGKSMVNLTQTSLLESDEHNPNWSPDRKKIVFDSTAPWFDEQFRQVNYRNIWMMDSDGGHLVNLTHGGGRGEYGPAWSPDGKRIAFIRNLSTGNHVMVMNADGSNLQDLGGEAQGAHLSWSRDSRIVAAIDGDRVATVDVNGEPHRWMKPPVKSLGNADPDWNPASDVIAYVQQSGENTLRVLNFPDGPDSEVAKLGAGANRATWAPDGRRLAYHVVGQFATDIHVIDVRDPAAGDKNLTAAFGGRNQEPDWASATDTKPAEKIVRKPVAGLIYCEGNHDHGQGEIYLLKDGEKDPVNLSNSPGEDQQGAWSCDATKIAFCSGRQTGASRDAGKLDGVYVMNADGTDPYRVIECYPGQPRWHPDGKSLLVLFGDHARLARIGIDGTGFHFLTGASVAGASYSPDGKKIAVIMAPEDTKVGPPGLYVMNPDGTGAVCIVPTSRGLQMCGTPRWSPDGKCITFGGSGGAGSPGILINSLGSIYTVNVDGTNLRWNHLQDDYQPMFLPGMKKIAYIALDHGGDYVFFKGLNVYTKNINGVFPVRITNGISVIDFDYSPISADELIVKKDIPYDITAAHSHSGQDTSYDIWVFTEKGEKLTNITQTKNFTTEERNPCWSPDKTKVIFESNAPYWENDGTPVRTFRNIWLADADGSNRVNLTRHNDHEYHPIWSPDGKRIAFQRANGGEIWLMNAAGGEQRKLARGASFPMHFTWSRDGTRIALGGGIGLSSILVDAPNPAWEQMPIDVDSNQDPDWNPATDWIAYARRNTAEHTLRQFNFPGGPDALISKFDFVGHPSWSPDGCRIVVHQDQARTLTIVEPHHDAEPTFTPIKLDGYTLEPDWASAPYHDSKPKQPGGTDCYIICCKVGGAYVLSMTKADGVLKEVGRFTAERFMDDFPVFSANGKRCAVATAGTTGKILLSNLDGKESVAVVDGLFPCFSPDGTKLAYLCSTNPWEVNHIDLDQPAKAVRRQGAKAKPNGDRPWMAWSPDSTTLYFAGDFADTPGYRPDSVYRLDAKVQAKLWEVPDQRLFKGVSPSPDGKTLLVTCLTTASRDELYLVNTDGSGGKRILDGFYAPDGPWSADGQRIFAASRDKLISCKPDGTDQKQLLQGGFNFLHWLPRGDKALLLGKPMNGEGQGLYTCGVDGSDVSWMSKIQGYIVAVCWCGDGKAVGKADGQPAVAGDYVLKGGKYRISYPTYPGEDMIARMNAAGWEVSGGTVTRKVNTRVGPIGEEKPVTYNGKLDFAGPPDVIKAGQTFELSMAASGDWESGMSGSWRIRVPFDKKEGVEDIKLSKPGTSDPPPTSGKLTITAVATDPMHRDHVDVGLTLFPDFEILWEYERKK